MCTKSKETLGLVFSYFQNYNEAIRNLTQAVIFLNLTKKFHVQISHETQIILTFSVPPS